MFLLQELSYKLPSLLDSIQWHDSTVECISYGSTFNDLVFANQADIDKFTDSFVASIHLDYCKVRYIQLAALESNTMRDLAINLITSSASSSQVELYRLKYEDAKLYAAAYEERVASNQPTNDLPLPVLIQNEALAINMAVYDLSLEIINQHDTIMSQLKAYFGTIEGERRLLKQRILDATTTQELCNITWAVWPEFTV